MKADRAVVHEMVLGAWQRRGSATPDEIAEELGLSVLSVRPVATVLTKQGVLAPNGQRGPTRLGSTARVMAVVK